MVLMVNFVVRLNQTRKMDNHCTKFCLSHALNEKEIINICYFKIMDKKHMHQLNKDFT